jgi:uncharacterized protein YceK
MKILTSIVVSVSLLIASSGCGTLMFKERESQGHTNGRVDPNVVIMDSLGLLLFVLPGLVAFGVDFSTDAIFLPPNVVKGQGPFIFDPDTKASATPKP